MIRTAFLLALLIEHRAPTPGDDFRRAEDGLAFRLTLTPPVSSPPEDLRHNPFGVWQLQPAKS